MRALTELFKLLSDVQRLRVLMLLVKKELSVCQLMGITGVSQPLVSRNLSLLYRGGFLEERREGKLRFYRVRTDLSQERKDLCGFLTKHMKSDRNYGEDMETLRECSQFQKKVGRCDMKTLQEFMEWKKKKVKRR